MRQIFVDLQYSLSTLRRGVDLRAFTAKREAAGFRPLIVDCGANIGATTLYFSTHIPNATVIAIEPERSNFELLVKNMADRANTKTVYAAISSVAGRAHIVDAGIGNWGYRTEFVDDQNSGTDSVPCITMREIYASHSVGFFPLIVKIDIEGAERDLFAAHTEWVSCTPLIIIELHDWLMPKAGTSRSFLQCVASLDRDFVHIGENIFSIANDLDALGPIDIEDSQRG